VKSRLAAIAAVMLALSACESPSAHEPASAVSNAAPISIAKPPPTLAQAILAARDLGPADAATHVELSIALGIRNASELSRLLASGETIGSAEYAARFGPDPSAVTPGLTALRHAGLTATWQAPSSVIAAGGPAPAVASLLHVEIESYRLADGSTFFAARGSPVMPPALAAVASGVSGLDNYRRARVLAVRPGGLTPDDVLAYYNVKPLRDAGLDGSGETVVLPEIDDLPNLNDLEKFAREFNLPAFGPLLTVKRNSAWGTPEKPAGETALDLEIVHSVAPNARLVIYLSAPDFGHGARAFDQMVTDHLGSIISESLGTCESDTSTGVRDVYSSIQDRARAVGMTHFVASGDNGAFTCGFDQDPAGSFPSTLPSVTAVGGTSVFESQEGVYFKEYAWGSAIDQSGGGGGISKFYPAPDYQRSATQAFARGQRAVPDVAADGDPSTGFHIVFGGRDGQAGGTSAATPLWAGVVALIDQDLRKKKLREVGFANPALYWMGANAGSLNPKPFHDVTAGNNLGYDAVSGWDAATGWGSMDAAGLDAAWVRYIKANGA
jgi:kumamolisin